MGSGIRLKVQGPRVILASHSLASPWFSGQRRTDWEGEALRKLDPP